MRILALHGLGASSAMLKEQLAPFTRMLGSSCHIEFLDGHIACGRGPAVPGWASGPFKSYTSGFTPSEMKAAHEHLRNFLDSHGPFDGVIGFSLGAAMAISYTMEQRRMHPNDAPPFAFAVFFSPIFIASADESCYQALVEHLLDNDHEEFRATFPHEDFLQTLIADEERVFAEYLRVVLSMHTSVGNILPDNDTRFEFFDEGQRGCVQARNVPRLMHPTLLKDRLRIPSVIVTGEKDISSLATQAKVAEMMCLPSSIRSYRHSGGHDVPFKRSDVQAIVSLMKQAAEDGAQMLSMYDL